MHWSSVPLHIIDFEGSRVSGILEVGVVTLRAGRVAETYTRLCRPEGAIPERDRRVHGIDDREAAGCERFICEWERFVAMRREGLFGAHGAGTENSLLKSVWPYGRPARDYLEPASQTNEWGPWIDTARIYGSVFPDLETVELGELVSVFSCEKKVRELGREYCPEGRCRYHAALYDALAAAVLLLELLERPEFGGATVQWLLQMSRGAEGRRRIAQRRLFAEE